MSKKMQPRAMYGNRDDSSISSAEAELGLPLSDTEDDTEETTNKTNSDLGSLVDDMNSVGVNSDQAVGSVGRSNASSGMTSVPTPQRERRRRRLRLETDTPTGRAAPLNLPFDDDTIFSPLSRKRTDELSPLNTIQSVTSMSDSSDTGIERSISREQFYQNTMREKKEAKKKNSLEAAGAGDESDIDSELSFDGDDDDLVVDELMDETTPWKYIDDEDYNSFLEDITLAYLGLRNRPDLQERIINHLEIMRKNIPQNDQQRVSQLMQYLTYLQNVRSGMLSYPSDNEQNTTSVGSKRKRTGGKKRRTRKHKNARGGGACMSTGKKPDEHSSRVFSRKKVHWDTGKIRSESGKNATYY